MKLAAMEALYDGRERAPLTVIGVLRPEAEREAGDVYRFDVEIPAMLSLMSYRDADAYVAGINDLVDGNAERGIMSVSEKMERGRRAIGELARYREALRRGDEAEAAAIARSFDPAASEGAAFLKDYFAYLGYGYLTSPRESVPNVPTRSALWLARAFSSSLCSLRWRGFCAVARWRAAGGCFGS